MVTYNWIKLREHPELVKQSANWFSSKWGVPAVVYEESIRTGIANKESIPQWYVVLDEKEPSSEERASLKTTSITALI